MRSPSERVMKNKAHPGDAFVPMSAQEKSPDPERHLFVARLESAIELAERPALQTPAHDLQWVHLLPYDDSLGAAARDDSGGAAASCRA